MGSRISRLKTIPKLSDVDICISLAPNAGEHYRIALDVMASYPDYAKVKFRIVAEYLISALVERFRLEIIKTSLFESINELYACQIIDRSLRDQLHVIRIAGNAGVHSGEKQRASTGGAEELDSQTAQTTGDLQSAIAVRKTLVGVFESVFLLLNKGEKVPEICMVEVGDLTSQNTLWRAVTALDFEAKLAAGLILESQSMAPLSSSFIIGNSEEAHKKTTKRMAVELYWAACQISAGLDRFSFPEIEFKGGKEACLFKLANTEALYQFGQLTYANEDEAELKRLGVKALEVSASRGYAPACALYGDLLRQQGRHEEALSLLEIAISKGEITAFSGMAILFVENEWRFHSKTKAEQFLKDGIQRGSDHCEYLLGRWLYDGNFLDEDKKRGVQLLELAASKGHGQADMFLKLCVDDQFVKGMQRKALELLSLLGPRPTYVKQGRNDPCQCKSGKKYKKCCGA